MIGIVILSYNNAEQTRLCIESLRAHCKGDSYKLCVVDNASRKEEASKLAGIVETLQDGISGPHLIVSSENGGYARGNNIGLEYFYADPDIDKLLVLNDDTRFTEDILTPLASYLDSHEECGVVFPLVFAPDGTIDKACARHSKTTRDLIIQATSLGKFGIRRHEFMPTEGLWKSPDGNSGTIAQAIHTEVPPGSCMMLPKELFHRIGWLDPNTFLYFEEHILSEKLKRENKTCVLLPDISIIHLGAQSTKKQPSKAVYKHWRNSYLYYMRTYSKVPAFLQRILQLRTWIKTL